MRGGRRQAPDSGRAFRDEVFGYVTPWNTRGYAFARAFLTKQDFVSPVWLQVREDANCQPDTPGTHIIDAQWVSDVRRSDGRGPAIVPRVMYERNSLSESDVSVIIDALLTLADEHAFEGFVFDGDRPVLWIPIVPGTMDLLTRADDALQGAGKLLILVLQCASNRSALGAILRAEMRISDGKYTDKQLAVLQKTCDDIVSKSLEDIQLATTPEWFIPWIWLEMNEKQLPEEGEFGSVITARWVDSEIVVKKLEINPKDAANADKKREMRQMFEREVEIWFGLSHPHVVLLIGACHIGRPFLVCELASNGALVEYLRHHPDELWSKLREAALGVQYLHARGIVHGDLKGNNIMVGGDRKAKVTDFGLSVFDDDSAEVVVSGAWHWVAPECILGQKPTFASDIYSLGMCIIEALKVTNGDKIYLPWGELPNAAVKFHVTRRHILPQRPQNCTNKAWTLIERMCKSALVERMLIMTVVDELEKLAGRHGDLSAETVQIVSDNGEMHHLTSFFVADTIDEMKSWIAKCDTGSDWEGGVLAKIYQLLWDRLEQVATQFCPDVEDTIGIKTKISDLIALVEHSKQRTQAALNTTDVIPLIKFTESALGGYALHRRLDKFMAAHAVQTDSSTLYDWMSACSTFMGVSISPTPPSCEGDCRL